MRTFSSPAPRSLAFLAILCQVKAKLASMVWGHHLGVLATKPS